MVITPIDHGLDYIGKSKSSGDRGVGLHMSDLYSSYYADLEPKKYDKSRPLNPMLLEMGLAWEDMLEDGLKERMRSVAGEDIERPGEFQTPTGIYYNPDLLIFSDKGPDRLGEIKLTWMSGREMPTTQDCFIPKKFGKYEMQIKAYLYWLGLLHARLYVFFVNGDYAWMSRKPAAKTARGVVAKEETAPIGPILRAYDLEYSQHELDENWSVLEMHGKTVGLLDSNGRAIGKE